MTAAHMLRLSRPALATAVAMLWIAGCRDAQAPGDDSHRAPSAQILSTLLVSNPVTSGVASGAGPSLSGSSSADGSVYVSLPPGSVPNGEQVVIQARRTGAEVTIVMIDGGFDPIPIAASAGDTLDIGIEIAGGGEPLAFFGVVPPRRPPVVVRTDPPPRKRDVPLNAVMLLVFSEPIHAATLTPSSIQLLLGDAPVAGTLDFGDDANLIVTFTPSVPLEAGAEYTLHITQKIQDLDGDALEAPATVQFVTEPSDPGTYISATISGVVRGVTTTGMNPLDGARVDFFGYHESGGGSYLGPAFTDNEGRYSKTYFFPASGSVNVFASHTDFRWKPCVNFGDGTQDIVLYSEEVFQNDGVQPPPDASPMVSGIVYEDVEGELTPLPGVTVYLDLLDGLGQVGATALSNSNGEYFLCRIPAGAPSLVVQALRPGGDIFDSEDFFEKVIAAEDQELDIVFGR